MRVYDEVDCLCCDEPIDLSDVNELEENVICPNCGVEWKVIWDSDGHGFDWMQVWPVDDRIDEDGEFVNPPCD